MKESSKCIIILLHNYSIYQCQFDIFTRAIIGYHEGLRCRNKEALKVLDQAVENLITNDLVLRTDHIVQYRSRDFQTRIRELDISS